MGKQWWEYGIEILITFGATFAGVALAIWADNHRETNDNRQRKIRLVKALLAEVSELERFFEKTKELEDDGSYNIETHVVDDTVQDQITCFENMELILKLSSLRKFTKVMTKRFEELENSYLQSRISGSFMGSFFGKKNDQDAKWDRMIEAKKQAWEDERSLGLKLTACIVELLKKEEPSVIKDNKSQ